MSEVEFARVPRGQLSLFARPTVEEVLSRWGLQPHVPSSLLYDGHLSFQPEPKKLLQPAAEAELEFLCALVRLAGMRGLARLLSGLRAPYAYRLELLELNLRHQTWRLRSEEGAGHLRVS